MPPLRPVRKRYTQCSGDDSSPASPAEELAPVGCYEYEYSTSGLTAGWRQVAAATSGTSNDKPNVAAMIHRHSSPARGWPSLDVMNTNIQRVALRPGGGRLPPLHPVRKRYTQCSGDDSSPSSPARGWPRGMFGIRTSNEWPYGQVAAGCRRYIRYVNGMRNVAAMIHRQPAPARGWPPLDVTNTNVQRVALRPGGGRLPPLHPVRTTVCAM